LSKHNRDEKEKDKFLREKLDRENKVLPLNIPKSHFVNSKKLKNSIRVGEPLFKRELRNDELRAGYTHLLEKLGDTQHLLV
jgi:hypothetical protein